MRFNYSHGGVAVVCITIILILALCEWSGAIDIIK